MAIHITKQGIRATGSKDANGLFIAIAPDEKLLEWKRDKRGSEEFQQMVKEAIAARGLSSPNEKGQR